MHVVDIQAFQVHSPEKIFADKLTKNTEKTFHPQSTVSVKSLKCLKDVLHYVLHVISTRKFEENSIEKFYILAYSHTYSHFT